MPFFTQRKRFQIENDDYNGMSQTTHSVVRHKKSWGKMEFAQSHLLPTEAFL
jgi:hypothetical protein